MVEMSLEYWNKLANHYIVISSLLGGFSITVIANLIIYDSKNRFMTAILKAATIAAGSFLATIFTMSKIYMMTTKGFPYKVVESSFSLARIIGPLTFFIGIFALSVVIALSGWTKSKRLGIFTTSIGSIILLIMLLMSIDINF